MLSPEDVNGMGGYSGIITSMKGSCSLVAGTKHEEDKAVAWCALQTGFTYNRIVNPSQLHSNFTYRIQSTWAV